MPVGGLASGKPFCCNLLPNPFSPEALQKTKHIAVITITIYYAKLTIMGKWEECAMGFYVFDYECYTLSYRQTKDVRIKNSFLHCSHGHSTCTLALGERCYSFEHQVVLGSTDESLHNPVRSNHRRSVAYCSYYAPTNLGTSL